MKCSIEGCARKYKAKGYCNSHYENLRLTGSPVRSKPRGHPHNYGGNTVGYRAVHIRLEVQRGKAGEHICSCGDVAIDWCFDEPTGFSTDLSRYTPLCRYCHRKLDRVG